MLRKILSLSIVIVTVVSILVYQKVEASRYDNIGWEYLHKFGQNTDIDTAANEDIWDGGGDYPWPTAAAETTVVSTDVDDTAAGTGARTVTAIGLDSNYLEITEVITLSGTTPVTFTNQFLRLHRASVATAGSTETNEGDLQFNHGATTIAQITTGRGQTLMAIYTIPADYVAAEVCKSYASVFQTAGGGSLIADMSFLVRPQNGAWQTKDVAALVESTGQVWDYDFKDCVNIAPKSDIRWRAGTTVNNANIIATFDLRLKRRR